MLENTPAGQDFLNNVVGPIGEQKLGLKIQRILVDPANADYASAVGTAEAGGADAIWGQLTEPSVVPWLKRLARGIANCLASD